MTRSSSASNQGQGGSNITESGNLTTPVPTSPITFFLEVINSQGSVTDEVLEVGYHSGVPSTNILFAYADSVTTTETSILIVSLYRLLPPQHVPPQAS